MNVLTLLLSAALFGQTTLPVPAVLPTPEVDPTVYGFRVAGDPMTNSRILQQIIDTRVSGVDQSAPYAKNITLPVGNYPVYWPVVLKAGCAVRGKLGNKSVTTLSTRSAGPVLSVLERTPNGVVLTPDHFVDLTAPGSPVVGAPGDTSGHSWGLCFKGDRVLVAPSSPIAFGPFRGGWPSCPEATIQFLYDFGAAGRQSQLCGSNERGACYGFPTLRRNGPGAQPEGIAIRFRTADGVDRSCIANMPLAGPTRVTVRVSPLLGQITAWQESTQVKITDTGLGADWAAGGHAFFAGGPAWGFGFEGVSPQLCSDVNTGEMDASGAVIGRGFLTGTLYGLSLVAGPLYRDLGVGSKLTRVDGASINDYQRYYSNQAYPATQLIWSWWPGFSVADMSVCPVISTHSVQGITDVGGYEWCWFLSPDSATDGGGTVKGVGVSDLTLTTVGNEGCAVTWAHMQLGRLERVVSPNGFHGLDWGANYPVDIWDCDVGSGTTGAIVLNNAIGSIRDTRITRCGRWAIFAKGCRLDISGVDVWQSGTPEYILAMMNGGIVNARYITHDFEFGSPYPSQGVIYAEPHRDSPPQGMDSLTVETIVGISPKRGIALRKGPSPAGARAYFNHNGLCLDNRSSKGPVIETDATWTINGPNEGDSTLPWISVISTTGVKP